MTSGEALPRIGPTFEVSFHDEPAVRLHLTDPAMAQILAFDTPTFEQFRVLRSRVESMSEKQKLQCVGVVGAASGEGTTTTALGLAMALAQKPGRRVLLVDAALRRSSLETYLGLPATSGLREWLELETAAEVPVRRVDPAGFFLLSAGAPTALAGELISSDRMAKLLQAARQFFDYVVVDCPSLVPVADSVFLQPSVDGFLLVIRARHTRKDTIAEAAARLEPGAIRGVVYNGHRTPFDFLDRFRRRRTRA